LKKAVSQIELLDGRHLTLHLAKDGNHTVRPAQVLRKIFQLTEEQILSAIITKKKANHA
jgi:hypothetical protein